MIITDHHTAPDMIPRAKAVINLTSKGDCPYKDKNLSALKLPFKLCQSIVAYQAW